MPRIEQLPFAGRRGEIDVGGETMGGEVCGTTTQSVPDAGEEVGGGSKEPVGLHRLGRVKVTGTSGGFDQRGRRLTLGTAIIQWSISLITS